MGIYRGPGGAGDATADASSQAAITVIARDEAVAAKNAAQLAQAAAELAETNAETAETGANTAKTAAQTAATNAASSASAASSSASSSATSATNAATSATNAATSETNAAAYELSANEWATKTSGPVAGGEYSSKYNAQLAATSASGASTSATNAASSASAAATSATNAASSASSASTSATTASNSATSAAGSATSASASASSASTSATNAAASATSASDSATTATTQAGIATTKAGEAATSATNAASSATNAASSATSAASSATSASSAQAAAESARDSTLAAYDSFDDRYLGVKTSDPTLDNDGNALVAGALYFSSTDGAMKVYTGTNWTAAYVSGAGVLLIANNLSDVSSVSSARSNLGLGTAATTAATDYATAAQGTKADTAYDDRYKWDGGSTGLVASTGRTSLGVTATGADTTYAYRSNNLSDLASASTARTNLGLGTAATTAATDYATAAQGTKADSALQPANIGSTVQGWDGDLDAIAALSGTSGLLKKTAANTWSLDTTSYATGGGSATGTNTGDETTATIQSKLGTASTSTSGYLTSTDWNTFNNKGTVSSVSVVSANGFGGSVANASSTPAITLTTSITGLAKGNGTGFSAATAGTDYLAPPSGTAILKANSGGALANATAGTDYVAPGTATTFTATQTFNGSSSTAAIKALNITEIASVSASAPSSTTNFDVNTGAVQYLTSNTTVNWTLNFRFSSGTSLATAMAVGDSISCTLLVTNSTTAYRPTAFQIDGSSVTPKWQGGSAPTAGNASSIDAYNFVIIKTAATPTYTVLASQAQFK